LEEYLDYHFDEDAIRTRVEAKEDYAEAQTAECTFLDLFRGKPSFNERAELKAYMRIVYDQKIKDEVSAQMELWCDELIAGHASVSNLGIESDTASPLQEALSPFLSSSDSSSREPRLWPLVSKVRSVYPPLFFWL